MPKTREAKEVSFSEIKKVLQNPHQYKGHCMVKGEIRWTWSQFERVQQVPTEFPGNILQPEGSRTFEPELVSGV